MNDLDGDQIADEWEQQFYGQPTSADPVANDDMDAYPVIVEYFNGLSPLLYEPYSPYRQIALPGSDNGWDTTADQMTLVADHLWRAYAYLVAASAQQFKFAADGSWT